MIKSCLIDVSKTSVDNGLISDGIIDLINGLQERGIKPFFVSNRQSIETRIISSNPHLKAVDILTTDIVGGRGKGSKRFVGYVCEQMNIEQRNILYLGDDQTDMQETANTAVIFLYARWTNTPQKYGIPMDSPLDILSFLDLYFNKPFNWGYRIEKIDRIDNSVNIYSLLSSKHVTRFRQILRLLKEKDIGVKIGSMLLSEYISFHLLSSIYLEGWHLEKPFWCLYPSSSGNQSGILQIFAENAARMFREKFIGDLLIRHTPAQSRHKTKINRNIDLPIDEQFQTIYVNGKYKDKIKGKNVILIDDFTTSGKSLEVGRNFLYQSGASKVYCLTVGKYPNPYKCYTPLQPFDPYSVNPELTESDFMIEPLETWSQYNDELHEYFMHQMQQL